MISPELVALSQLLDLPFSCSFCSFDFDSALSGEGLDRPVARQPRREGWQATVVAPAPEPAEVLLLAAWVVKLRQLVPSCPCSCSCLCPYW